MGKRETKEEPLLYLLLEAYSDIVQISFQHSKGSYRLCLVLEYSYHITPIKNWNGKSEKVELKVMLTSASPTSKKD